MQVRLTAGVQTRSAQMQNCAFRRGETAIFTKRSVDLAVDQLTRPILQPPQASRPHLAGLAASQKCRTRKGHSTKRSQASGWHAKTANLCVLLYLIAKMCIRAQKSMPLLRLVIQIHMAVKMAKRSKRMSSKEEGNTDFY